MPPVRDPNTGRFIKGSSAPVRAEIKGLAETKKKLEQVSEDLHGRPMVSVFQKATLLVSRDAKINAPVDTGKLRSSITTEVFTKQSLFGGNILTGVVGTNLTYAPYMEFGTGVFAGKKPHRPKAVYLEQWARRHKAGAYQVANAIAIRGGLKPRRYFQKAADKNRDKVREMIENAVSGIVRK